jgi:hypothetical protein
MKLRTIARLDMLAAEREARLREAIRRHGGALAQSRQQSGMLHAYRTRLAASWQDGTAITAAQARRASQFAQGAQAAAAQIESAAAQTAAQLQEAVAELARLKTYRRSLAGTLHAGRQASIAAAAQKAERDRPHKIFSLRRA